jgi:phage gp29-like protein
MAGLWINDKTFVELSENQPLSGELATRARCDYVSVLSALPDPDEVLRKMGRDITVYKEMLTDPHVGACVNSRKSGTKKRLWDIDRGKSKSRPAKFIENLFNDYRLRNVISEILDATWWGMQPIEIMWEPVGEMVLPVKLVGKPPEWFLWGNDGALKLRTRQNPNGEPLPARKFVIAQNNPRYQNPYGDRIAAQCFWYERFKRNGLKWWVVFAEKFGMPWLVGKTPRGSQKQENDDVLDILAKMVQDAIAVIPDDSSVEALKIEKSASVMIYEKLLQYCDASISKAVLGHSAGADSTPGRLGNERMAIEAREDLIDDDCALVEETLNQVIDWTIELNFGPNVERPKFILYEEEDVDQDQATRDKTLADTGMVQLTEQYFMREYGFEEGDIKVIDKSAAPPPPPAVELAESAIRNPQSAIPPDQADVDELLDGLPAEQLQEQIEGVLRPVIELVENAASYDEVREKLVSLYPKMDDTALRAALQKAVFLAQARGRLATQPVINK